MQEYSVLTDLFGNNCSILHKLSPVDFPFGRDITGMELDGESIIVSSMEYFRGDTEYHTMSLPVNCLLLSNEDLQKAANLAAEQRQIAEELKQLKIKEIVAAAAREKELSELARSKDKYGDI
jgi:hypothetical protein